MSPSSQRGLKGPRHLPRLSREHYQGRAAVLWTHGVYDRVTGWLTPGFYQEFREVLLHTCGRYGLACPAFCLMPDHWHLLWLGLNDASDQLSATAFLRKHIKPALVPARLQDRAHDHVLRKEARRRTALLDTCCYIRNNPVRAGLVSAPDEWPYAGAMLPGYPTVSGRNEGWWNEFWKAFTACVERKNRSSRD